MKRRIGVNSNCYHGYSIEEALDGIQKAGFHYVELTATKGWTEHVFPTQSFGYLNHLKDKMEQMDIYPYALSGHCNLMDQERLNDFVDNMALAYFFGCDYIVSSVGEAHLKDNTKTGLRQLRQNLLQLLPWLEKYDLILVLEIHGEHSTGAILKEITDTVGSERIKINYDTANAVFYGKVDPSEDMLTCIDDIAYMHLKDKDGEMEEWNFPALGEGKIRFSEIFRKLKEAENDCPFSVEIEFTPDGPGGLEQVNEAVRKSAEYLRKSGFEL